MRDTKSVWNLATEYERNKIFLIVNSLVQMFQDDTEEWVRVIKEFYNIIELIEARQNEEIKMAAPRWIMGTDELINLDFGTTIRIRAGAVEESFNNFVILTGVQTLDIHQGTLRECQDYISKLAKDFEVILSPVIDSTPRP